MTDKTARERALDDLTYVHTRHKKADNKFIISDETYETIREALQDDWQPIETFSGDMFILITNGTPEGTECFKYKGHLPSWATHWKPLPQPPKESEC